MEIKSLLSAPRTLRSQVSMSVTRGVGVFSRGANFKKRALFVKKALQQKSYSNHVPIKLAYSLKKKVYTCSRSLIFLFCPKIKGLHSKLFFHSKQTSASFASPKIHYYLKLTIFVTFMIYGLLSIYVLFRP